MENDREIDQVLMNINNITGGMISAAMFSATMTFKLMVFLLRMAKKGLVASGLADSFKSFTEKTGGSYSVYNIPLTYEKAGIMEKMNQMELELQKEKNPIKAAGIRNEIKKLEQQVPEIEQLKKLGIEYCVLPKLNGSNQTIQVAVAKKDDQMFKNWFLNHLTTELAGGKKDLEALKVFTEGNYTILNMPFEDSDELSAMYKDFELLEVNYAVLPDLNVGDGYTQIAVPNADRDKIEMWFKMWKDKQLSQGKEVERDMYAIDQTSYTSMAELNQDDYISASGEVYQQANAEFEKQAKDVAVDSGFGKENSEEYVKLMGDNNYSSIAIDKGSLTVTVPEGLAQEMDKKGYFVSRIPGTYGEHQEHLILPKNRVFEVNDGRTYLAFLHKSEKQVVVGMSGAGMQRSYEDVKPIYDKVQKNTNKIQYVKKGETQAHTIQKVKDQVMKPKIK